VLCSLFCLDSILNSHLQIIYNIHVFAKVLVVEERGSYGIVLDW